MRGASQTLAWGWAAIAVWTPLLLLSALGRATFAADPGVLPIRRHHAPDYSAMDGEARERAYRDAAQQVDRSTRASRWF